jgi:hypothetical protein
MKKNEPDLVDEHKIAGHFVEIRKTPREELRIDGVRKNFFVTKDGYNLHDAPYAKPTKTLLDARPHNARLYFRTDTSTLPALLEGSLVLTQSCAKCDNGTFSRFYRSRNCP